MSLVTALMSDLDLGSCSHLWVSASVFIWIWVLVSIPVLCWCQSQPESVSRSQFGSWPLLGVVPVKCRPSLDQVWNTFRPSAALGRPRTLSDAVGRPRTLSDTLGRPRTHSRITKKRLWQVRRARRPRTLRPMLFDGACVSLALHVVADHCL